MSPPSVPRLHCLHVLPLRLMSLVADTALPVGGVPSSLPGIGLAVADKVGSVPAVVDMVVVVVLATVYILFPLSCAGQPLFALFALVFVSCCAACSVALGWYDLPQGACAGPEVHPPSRSAGGG